MKGHFSYLLHSIPTQILKQRLISIHVLSFCTEDFTAINLPCRYGVCDSCCQTQLQNTPIQFIKRYKWHRTVLNWFVGQAQQQFLTEMGYCRYISTLNFPSRSLGKKNGSGKIPQASIIVSRTWKLRFTSNSISRSGTGLEYYQFVQMMTLSLTWPILRQGQSWSRMLLYWKKVKQWTFQKLL